VATGTGDHADGSGSAGGLLVDVGNSGRGRAVVVAPLATRSSCRPRSPRVFWRCGLALSTASVGW